MDKLPQLHIAEGIKTGDLDAISYVYKTLGPKIIGYVINNSGTKEDGKELFQSTYVKAFENLKANKYREEGKFEEWFNRIAMNLWQEELRRRRRTATQNLEDIAPIADDNAEGLEQSTRKNRVLEALNRALNHIGEPCASLLRRFHGEESVSSQELAAEFGKSDDAMRKKLFDCRKKIRKLMEEEMGDNE